MAETPETLTPTPKPTPQAFPASRWPRIVSILKGIIGNQALQIAELQATLEERTASLRAVSAELDKIKPAAPAKE